MSNVGWKTVWDIYPRVNIVKSLIKAFFFWVILVVLFFFSDKSPLVLLEMLSDMITSVFPNVIGFALTGHVLMVGFSGSDFLLKLAKTSTGDKYSLFQIVNSTFAIVILVMVVTLLSGIVCKTILSYSIEWPFESGVSCYNSAVLFILLFLVCYSILSLFDIVINIFNMGQMSNAVARNKIKALEEEKEELEEDKQIKLKIKKILNFFLFPFS